MGISRGDYFLLDRIVKYMLKSQTQREIYEIYADFQFFIILGADCIVRCG